MSECTSGREIADDRFVGQTFTSLQKASTVLNRVTFFLLATWASTCGTFGRPQTFLVAWGERATMIGQACSVVSIEILLVGWLVA